MAVGVAQRASIVAAATATTRSAAATTSSSCDSSGSPASTVGECNCCLTDSEWAAAWELVLLSAGTARPSPFITARPLPPADGFHEFPRVRRQRLRSLASLYVATSPVGGGDGGDRDVRKRGAATAYGGWRQNKRRKAGMGRPRSPSVSAVFDWEELA